MLLRLLSILPIFRRLSFLDYLRLLLVALILSKLGPVLPKILYSEVLQDILVFLYKAIAVDASVGHFSLLPGRAGVRCSST